MRGGRATPPQKPIQEAPMSEGPFAEKKFIEINGCKMAYIDEGEGAPIVFPGLGA